MNVTKFNPDYIVGITRGGLLPALMISHYIAKPMHALDVSLRDKVSGPESNAWMSSDAFEGKNILVVDDINDSGKTLQWIKDDWMSGCHPDEKDAWDSVWGNTAKFATLVNNDCSEFKDVDYHHVSVNRIETPDIWVTFPWEDWWLN